MSIHLKIGMNNMILENNQKHNFKSIIGEREKKKTWKSKKCS